MPEKKPTIYVPGSAKARQAPFGEVLRVSFPVQKMVTFLQSHANAKGYVNIEVVRRETVGQFGDTHSMKLDTWEPQARPDATGDSRPLSAEEIPF